MPCRMSSIWEPKRRGTVFPDEGEAWAKGPKDADVDRACPGTKGDTSNVDQQWGL